MFHNAWLVAWVVADFKAKCQNVLNLLYYKACKSYIGIFWSGSITPSEYQVYK